MCEDRVANGGIPTCALHCLANVIHYGEPEELARMAAEKGMQRPIIMIR
jgi:anaerobic dimethyl sulfoxide reductase subunit B (iron-sulfur subunit)